MSSASPPRTAWLISRVLGSSSISNDCPSASNRRKVGSTPCCGFCRPEESPEPIDRLFSVIPRKWRGIGEIAESGWGLRKEYLEFDAEHRFGVADTKVEEPAECMSGLVLQGLKKPGDCPAFGKACTPASPLGPCMVSTEGSCAAYYQYRLDG